MGPITGSQLGVLLIRSKPWLPTLTVAQAHHDICLRPKQSPEAAKFHNFTEWIHTVDELADPICKQRHGLAPCAVVRFITPGGLQHRSPCKILGGGAIVWRYFFNSLGKWRVALPVLPTGYPYPRAHLPPHSSVLHIQTCYTWLLSLLTSWGGGSQRG